MRLYLFVLILVSSLSWGQDSTKIFQHEIGVNVVGLIKQTISNTPTVTIPQLPYTVFYTLTYKEIAGLRLGAGYFSEYTEVEIPGQQLPRVTDEKQFDLRIGLTYNIVRSKRFQVNFFADYIRENYSTKTINTVTVQVFPNPKQTITTEIAEETKGEGFQAGVGVAWHLHKYISLYTETPFTYVARVFNSYVIIDDSGDVSRSNSTSRSYTGKIFPPATIYLVLRF